MSSFVEANAGYEGWLRSQCDIVESDLAYKHKRMKKDAFRFLRATCFRWSAEIESLLGDVAGGPSVLAIGDCHTENFGTWRDDEGRWVWGANDFDDTAVMPFSLDLIRLATSARLAPERDFDPAAAAESILSGYLEGLDDPRPALIDEVEIWLRNYVGVGDEERRAFWTKIDGLEGCDPPANARKVLEASLPAGSKDLAFARRLKQGGGSLGRPRFVVIAHWQGGRVVREAKALVASSWDYAHGKQSAGSRYDEAARGRYRSSDPFLKCAERYVVRRLWPDSRKVEFGGDAGEELHGDLLRAMGREVASVHAATEGAVAAIKKDLVARPAGWLTVAAKRAAKMVTRDYEEWREHYKSL